MLKTILAMALLSTLSVSAMFQSVEPSEATLIQSGKDKLYCPNCGMNLPKFYKTNHTHKNSQYCSLHCLAESNPESLDDVKVVDTNTLKFIDAHKAFYVVGSKVKGTMTNNSKYAFSTLQDAKDFVQIKGGKVMNFEEAYKVALEDLANDNKMIGIKRQKMIYPKGKLILKKMCDNAKIDISNFQNIAQLKAYLRDSDACKPNKLEPMQLQALSLYLWHHLHAHHGEKISVPKDAKCPVCGMFVAKYPKWAAQIKDDKGGDEYFDGVKDMMKYIFAHKKSAMSSVRVTDYYTTMAVDANKAYYVISSNIYGPMGNELIPFSSKEAASDFVEHHGGKVLTYNEITKEVVKSLDE